LQLELLVFQRGHECLDEGQTLFGLLCIADKEFVVAMRLEFRRLIPEGSPDTLTEPKLRAGSGCIAIGKAFPSEILHLSKELLELLHCTGDIFYCNGLRPRPFR
jgi:hypothetical protein